MKRFEASVDSVGRITYIPTKKTFKALDPQAHLGQEVKVITCLNNSETFTQTSEDGRRKKILITRVYSLSGAQMLLGHACRFVLENVRPVYQESGYKKVILTNSKTPHAWLKGRLKMVLRNDDHVHHAEILASMSNAGKFVAYDPYKSKTFRFCNERFLPSQKATAQLCEVCPEPDDVLNEVYCYESGILGR